MKYDDLVTYLGELGPYQIRSYVLAMLPCVTAAIHTLLPVFILAVPEHRCSIPGYPNDSYSSPSAGGHRQALMNYSLPWRSYTGDEEDPPPYKDAECQVYTGRTSDNFPNSSDVIRQWGSNTSSCHQWVYSTEIFDNSFVTQENLVCDDKILRAHANMIYMCGLLVGSFLFGQVSDRFGRKPAFLSALVLHTASTITLAFADSFVFFAIVRFLIALSSVGLFMCCFVLGIELLGPQYRAQGGIGVQYFWIIGMFALNVVAYFIRDWFNLQLAMSCYTVVYLLLYWFVPESPRWQISQGQLAKAKVTMEKVAKANGKELPKDAFTEAGDKTDDGPKGSMADLFASPVLLARAVVVFINWMVVTMVYYGLTLNVGSLGGSIYVNFAVSGVVELVANVVALFALPVVGRKKFHCFSMLLGGTACLACMIPSLIGTDVDPWVLVVLSNVGKLGATGGFSTIYVYTAELFPTFMRNSVVGASSMVARLGGIAAPYIADLGVLVGGPFGAALPYIVFGACSVMAGLLALTLPETLNMGTPETIQDAIHFGKAKPATKNVPAPQAKYTVKTETNGKEAVNMGYEHE